MTIIKSYVKLEGTSNTKMEEQLKQYPILMLGTDGKRVFAGVPGTSETVFQSSTLDGEIIETERDISFNTRNSSYCFKKVSIT